MPQIFRHSTNYLARTTIFGAAFMMLAALWVGAEILRSGWNTGQYIERQQPIQFSHKHHVGDDGIDCRYCHSTVETSASAGMPATAVCMSCHKQIWADSPYLEQVRSSLKTGKPLEWVRVHDLPDFAYFNHSIHIAKGVGCSTCHGRIDQMPVVSQTQSLQMEWCLDCHRSPQKYVRPKDKVFDMEYKPVNSTKAEIADGLKLVSEYHIQTNAHNNVTVLTSCSTCHR
ncbi:MAG TPA: cytochrome c3 family protein [Pyrinomonadaceae bacterium]|nr:cytochrome c3 family protein [Pyrinomonadaceae bacterium]